MRPYRGKRIDNGEEVRGWYWCNEEAGDFYKGRHFIRSMNFQPAEFDYTDYEVDPATVGQSTGRKDKKRTKEFPEGQKIYEGDIVAWWYSRTKKICFTDIVVWSNEKAGWILKEHPVHRIDLFTPEQNLEVIGNGYDTPKLLEQK